MFAGVFMGFRVLLIFRSKGPRGGGENFQTQREGGGQKISDESLGGQKILDPQYFLNPWEK